VGPAPGTKGDLRALQIPCQRR